MNLATICVFVFVFFLCSVGRSIIPLLPGGCRRRLVLKCMEKMLLQRNRYKMILIFNRCWKIWAWRQCFFCMKAAWSCAYWKWPINLVLRVKTANNTVVMRAIQVISLASFPFVWFRFFLDFAENSSQNKSDTWALSTEHGCDGKWLSYYPNQS